jgi:sulfate adenylyltransferase subunit 2
MQGSVDQLDQLDIGTMDHLDQLENRSVHILREAYANFKNLGMLWSIGKDSTVLLWLARKAFFGHVPIPLIHIDTSYKIPEMIEYRDRLALEWNLTMIYGQNRQALEAKRTFPDGAVDRIACCKALKTDALKHTLSGEWPRYRLNHTKKVYELDRNTEPFTGVIVGARADEEGSRSKERYFSPRTAQSQWDVGDQPPEFWNQYKTDFAPGTHLRIHPATGLDRAQHLGVHQAGEHPHGLAVLQPGNRPALSVTRVLHLHQPGGVGRP